MNLVPHLNAPAAIVGTTGSGKTYAAKGAVEALLAEGRRVIIIDPTGAWYGLRSGADGDQDGGFPVLIFGGDHADVPITDRNGDALAEELAQRDVQAIIDISEFTGGEKRRFLTPFLERLYAKNRSALHLVVDEADEIAAQRFEKGEERLFGAFDRIVRRGRIKGFRPMMISQRPAVIHKNVLSQIGTLIALKLTSPQDRKAIREWVEGNADTDQAKEVMTSLPTLSRGEGWVWAPADSVLERTTFPAIRTFDSSRTPEIGETAVKPALSAVDVAGLRDALTFEPSNEAAKTNVPTKSEIEAAEKRGYERGETAAYRKGAQAIKELMDWTVDEIDRFKREIGDMFQGALGGPWSTSETPDLGAGADGSNQSGATSTSVTSAGSKALGDLSPSARKIVEVVLARYPVGITLVAAAKRAGLSKKSSAYRSHLRDAAACNLIGERGNGVFVALDAPDGHYVLPGLEEIKRRLPPSYARMLSVLESVDGGLTKATIAERADISPTSSGLGSGLRELVELDLIIKADDRYELSGDLR